MSYTNYDPMTEPILDAALWQPLDMGTERLEPGAVTTVSEGTVTVTVPAFANASAEVQGLDNAKHVILSTQPFPLAPDGITRFAVDVAVDHIGGTSDDYRLGSAAFVLVDLAGGTGAVLDLLSTAGRSYAEHEVLPYPGIEDPFTRVIESPWLTFAPGEFRSCEIAIDRGRGRVRWSVDGRTIHEAAGLDGLPESVHVGFGYFTLILLGQGGSVRGQGARASWRNFRHEHRSA